MRTGAQLAFVVVAGVLDGTAVALSAFGAGELKIT